MKIVVPTCQGPFKGKRQSGLVLLLLFVWGAGFTQELASFSNSLPLDGSFSTEVDLNTVLEFADQPDERLLLEELEKVDNWLNFSEHYQEKEEKRIWARIAIDVTAAASLRTVLYLHDLQSVNVYLKTPADIWTKTKAGRLVQPSKLLLPAGLVMPGKGHSTQVPLELQPGRNHIYLEVDFYVRGPFRPRLNLYPEKYWQQQVGQEFERRIGVHLLFIGALWMLAIYHLLIYLQRRDPAFFWYALYTLISSFMIMIESGVMQIFITPGYPKINLLYRILLPHALLGYITYWLFLRSFINLKVVLPKADRILRSFLLGITVVSLGMAGAFLLGIKHGNYLSLKGIDYLVPLSGLLFGIVYFFIIIRLRNKLINLLLLGSLILLAGVLLNTILSLGVFYGWWVDLPFPHFLITEGAVLLEVTVFALALGYRSQQAEYERSRVEQLNELKSRFFANISHEFRTPLTVISGMADEIKGNGQQVKLIKRNSKSLLQLVNQLLDLSKLDAGLLTTKIRTRDIISYLNYLTESFYSLAQEKDLRLNFYAEEAELVMDFDEVQVQQIVRNLLSNAIKFTPAGGKIIMHARMENEGAYQYLQLKVKDTGIGIEKAEQAQVFDRFYQVDAASTREGEGTGIGLALTKELVEHAGGTIRVESILGEWTEFTVKLPVRKTGEMQHGSGDVWLEEVLPAEEIIFPVESPSLPKTADRLLIIDDNPDIASYLQHLLANRYQMTFANNGQEGIDTAFEIIPDIIISDVMMPIKDGYEVCTTLKADERTSHIPIILLTAKAGEEDRVAGLAGGADAFLTKPFNKKELFIRLEMLIELRKKLQERYQHLTSDSLSSDQETSPRSIEPSQGQSGTLELDLENQFLRKIVSMIERRIDDPTLVVGDLAKEVRLSSMQVNRKLKALTGKTGNTLVRSIRLQRAKKLLLNKEMNVSEVAYSVGFNDPNYFSRAFSAEFGISPGEFLK